MKNEELKIESRIRLMIKVFLAGLIFSGLTAFPLLWELSLLKDWFIEIFGTESSVSSWILKVYNALTVTYFQFPFIAYGTDWLAFAHIAIGIFFIGPLIDPVKNKWIIQSGMIACILVIPLAIIAGPIREIPFYWQLIDCSFGILGILPLLYVNKLIIKLEKLKEENGTI